MHKTVRVESSDWCQIADADLVRLGASIYKASGRPPWPVDNETHAEGEVPDAAGGIKIAAGRGPTFCLCPSWEAFKWSYALAQHALIELIRPYIVGNTRRFEISFHRLENSWEYGYHKWVVFGASAESEARLAAGMAGDVTAEDAARVLRV